MERPGMEIPKPVGCISRDLIMQEVLHYFQSYPVYNVLLQDLKEESCFSILYYQAIKVCKMFVHLYSSFQIYCVNTTVFVNVNVIVFQGRSFPLGWQILVLVFVPWHL